MDFLHTMIRVSDIEKSLNFYTQLLEMRIDKQKDKDDCKLYFLSDGDNYAKLELEYHKNYAKTLIVGNGFGHFAFKVKSMDEFKKKLEQLGFEFSSPPRQIIEGGSIIGFIKDPDGYEIEIIEKKG